MLFTLLYINLHYQTVSMANDNGYAYIWMVTLAGSRNILKQG